MARNFHLELSISPIEDGESIPFVGRLRDMTERDGLRCALLGNELARTPRRLRRPTRSQLHSREKLTFSTKSSQMACRRPSHPLPWGRLSDDRTNHREA